MRKNKLIEDIATLLEQCDLTTIEAVYFTLRKIIFSNVDEREQHFSKNQ